MKTPILFLFVVLLATSVPAQQPASSQEAPKKPTAVSAERSDAPTREQLRKLFDVLEIQKQMGSVVSTVGRNMEKMLPESMGDVSEKQRTALENLNNELYGKLMTPEFLDKFLAELIPIYQRHFTKSDVDALIAFYESPVGKKFLREQPRVTDESLTKMLPLMQTQVQKIVGEMDYENRVRDIFAHQGESAASGTKK